MSAVTDSPREQHAHHPRQRAGSQSHITFAATDGHGKRINTLNDLVLFVTKCGRHLWYVQVTSFFLVAFQLFITIFCIVLGYPNRTDSATDRVLRSGEGAQSGTNSTAAPDAPGQHEDRYFNSVLYLASITMLVTAVIGIALSSYAFHLRVKRRRTLDVTWKDMRYIESPFFGLFLVDVVTWIIFCPPGMETALNQPLFINAVGITIRFCRNVVILRGVSPVYSFPARSIAYFLRTKVDSSLIIRAQLSSSPIITTSVFYIFTALCLSLFVHWAEGFDFGTSLWLIFITSTTVGYGDVVPVSAMGRIVAAITTILGLMLVAFIVGAVQSRLALTNKESALLSTVRLEKLLQERRELAALILQTYYRRRIAILAQKQRHESSPLTESNQQKRQQQKQHRSIRQAWKLVWLFAKFRNNRLTTDELRGSIEGASVRCFHERQMQQTDMLHDKVDRLIGLQEEMLARLDRLERRVYGGGVGVGGASRRAAPQRQPIPTQDNRDAAGTPRMNVNNSNHNDAAAETPIAHHVDEAAVIDDDLVDLQMDFSTEEVT